MNTPHSHDLIIGLDRSDKTADLHLITPATGQRRSQTIDTAPEALWEWLLELRQQHPQARVGLCLEQPAVHLIAFLEAYDWITLYPINPITLQKFREAFVTSRAKDAQYLAELLLTHHDQLQPWAPEDSATRAVQQLVFHRRAVVDERTALTNRLIALLKQYFPQALDLCGEDLWRPLATRVLLKWSSLQAVQKAKPATLKAFYPTSEVGLSVAATPRRRKVQATPSSPVAAAIIPLPGKIRRGRRYHPVATRRRRYFRLAASGFGFRAHF
jgi:hypothetical protein